ncbi:NAD-dependent epimerase/dehydratase family protein [Erythrobacter sp. THAF29]|uniref:NAD-dependent epimerase/dehydratase family protein n=1 Tax=Erythrobacter sp. THAF29 TaxID=2587851 RepID=UPI001268CBDC|nr:NAD-dependent epimerase/dehydratase family protein [Erythrobacter sp. THAF29]QFT78702.1 dTDP-L-rhamnose 4-epimerase [Erythrobacter sp. THAF29]
MADKHVLVTGGAGFIGSHLVDNLLERGYEVTILDALLPQVHADGELDEDGWPTYLNPKAHRIKGNLLDDGVFENALKGKTHLAHLAASVGVGQSMTNIVDYTRNNVMVAAIMLETLSKVPHSIERIAVASSMSIYGEGEYMAPDGKRVGGALRGREQLAEKQWELRDGEKQLEPIPTSEEKLLEPASIYAVNKRDHEEMFLAVGRALNIPVVALRLFNAYGSRQALSNPYTGVAAIFISRLLNDQAPLVFEDGEQKRDFVHVKDVANAFSAALESDREIWDVFNVGSGNAVTVNEIARTLARLLQKNISPKILEQYRVGDIRHCFADTKKLRETFSLPPARDFEDGMAELIEWVRTAPKPVDRGETSLSELRSSKLVV